MSERTRTTGRRLENRQSRPWCFTFAVQNTGGCVGQTGGRPHRRLGRLHPTADVHAGWAIATRRTPTLHTARVVASRDGYSSVYGKCASRRSTCGTRTDGAEVTGSSTRGVGAEVERLLGPLRRRSIPLRPPRPCCQVGS